MNLNLCHKIFEGRILGSMCDDIGIPMGKVAELPFTNP